MPNIPNRNEPVYATVASTYTRRFLNRFIMQSAQGVFVCPSRVCLECELGKKESGVRTARFIIQNQAIMHD